jgi:hypothetical protein
MRLAVCAVVACAAVRVAAAQPANDADRLFQEGLALFDEGKFDEACTKFEQSIAKDPRAIGTLMNLGRCNERRGKVATALKLFQEAYDRATEANAVGTRDKAQERIAALAAQVPVVIIKHLAPPLDGEKLVVDDAVVPLDKQELNLDPGTHTFVLTAPGRLPWQSPVTVAVSARKTVELPELQVPKNKTVVTRSSTRRVIGKIATFAGVGVVLVGSGLAVYAKHDYEKQFDDPDGSGPLIAHCGSFPPIAGKQTCDAVGQSRTERDRNIGTGAGVVSVLGLAAAATGVVLWVTAPGDERATVVPTGSASSVGLVLVGRF